MDGALTAEQIELYERNGLLVLENVVSQKARDRVAEVFQKIVDEYALELVDSGELSRLYDELPFEQRWAAIRAEVPASRPIVWRRILIDPAVYQLWFEPGLLGAAQSILGPEIRAYHLFNGRPREPHDPSQSIDWHQDAFNCDDWSADDSRILTFWIPLVPVGIESGCLAVVPGSHKQGVLPKSTDEFGITTLRDAPEFTTEPISVPMRPGDALMFNELVLHRSLDNISDRVRWSVDIRFSANEPAHQAKAPGGFRVSSEHEPPETFEEWVAKWDRKSGVMRRHLRRLDLYARSLSPQERRDVQSY
ncbi:hypothetical protein GCM10023319_53970 [Nocardia iowensis]